MNKMSKDLSILQNFGFEEAKKILDPRDPRPDPVNHPMFRGHNCWKCREGARPCVVGNPSQCEYPYARND